MEKLKMHTPDLVNANIERIAELFPACVTESRDEAGTVTRAIDFDLLRQELSDRIVEGPQERYRLDWPGKRKALLDANAPIARTLRPCRAESVDFDTTQNLFIEGDNLDALKLLQETYLGKVKMIYIDPPYNTGKDFIYKDDFAESTADYLERSNQQDEEGKLVANPDSNGRFHSDWLTMILPRLKLAKNLLKREGAVFVSCDEVEQCRLRLAMDEVFGMDNLVADMVWAAGRKNDSRLISVSHEYIVCYARDKAYLKEKDIRWRQHKKGLEEIYAQYENFKRQHGDNYAAITEDMKAWYRDLPDSHPSKAHKHFAHVDARGLYFPDNISWPGGGGPKYKVLHPVTGKPVRVPSRGWMTSDPEKMQRWIDEDRVHFGADENAVPCIKSYLKDREYQAPYSVFYQDGRAASKRLRALMGGDYFDFPKDEEVLQELLAMLTDKDDVVADLFGGMAPIAHALMAQNAMDGGRRHCITVQLPEPCDRSTKSGKAALDAGFGTIADLAKERIRRAGAKIKADNATKEGIGHLDVGFRVLKIDTSNMAEVYYRPDELEQKDLAGHVDNVKPDRSAEDLLFQVLLDWGVDLGLPIVRESIVGREVFFVDVNALAACFVKDGGVDEAFVKELAKRKPLRVVFRDAGFANDNARINVEQIFKTLSPDTEVRTL
jgi:adenine-specific DNA-methyltransferase